VADTKPDVVIMDYHLPDGDGGEATEIIRENCPGTAVIMLTGSGAEEALARAIEAGCAGFLVKELRAGDLADAIRAVHRGEVVIHAESLDAALPRLARSRQKDFGLTAREVEVLSALAVGSSTGTIAADLLLAPNTVRNHIQNILTKLGAHSKLEAVAIAHRDGLVGPTRIEPRPSRPH
jgi:DNA-binding NarL/FixJ family response regulator